MLPGLLSFWMNKKETLIAMERMLKQINDLTDGNILVHPRLITRHTLHFMKK